MGPHKIASIQLPPPREMAISYGSFGWKQQLQNMGHLRLERSQEPKDTTSMFLSFSDKKKRGGGKVFPEYMH